MSKAIIQESSGMTLRMNAAIMLRQPDSGIDWLDAMILKANRDWFAGQALIGIMGDSARSRSLAEQIDDDRAFATFQAKWAFSLADAMLKECDK